MKVRWLTVYAPYHVTKLGINPSSQFNGLQTKNTISRKAISYRFCVTKKLEKIEITKN